MYAIQLVVFFCAIFLIFNEILRKNTSCFNTLFLAYLTIIWSIFSIAHDWMKKNGYLEISHILYFLNWGLAFVIIVKCFCLVFDLKIPKILKKNIK